MDFSPPQDARLGRGEAVAFGAEVDCLPVFEEADEEQSSRIVGWSAGQAVRENDARAILRKSVDERQHYKNLRNLSRRGHKATSAEKIPQDPLLGLPSTWQAFWSTVPDLDAQTAYREYSKEKARRVAEAAKSAKAPRASSSRSKPTDDDDMSVDEDRRKLEEETQELRAINAKLKVEEEAANQALREWETKLTVARADNRKELVKFEKLRHDVEVMSYSFGKATGKKRSLEQYFEFLAADMKIAHNKKMRALTRSNNIMQAEMLEQKREAEEILRELEKHDNA